MRCCEDFVSGRAKSIYLANSHFGRVTGCEGLLLLCFPSYLGQSEWEAASWAVLALSGCSTGGVLLTWVAGTLK